MKKDAAMQRSQKRRRGRETPKRRPLPAPACKHQVQLRKKVVGTLILFQRLRMEDALEPSCEDAEPATAPLTTQMVDAAPGNEFVDEPPNDRVQEMPIENSTGEAEAMDVALPHGRHHVLRCELPHALCIHFSTPRCKGVCIVRLRERSGIPKSSYLLLT